jgi:hypothetical protein
MPWILGAATSRWQHIIFRISATDDLLMESQYDVSKTCPAFSLVDPRINHFVMLELYNLWNFDE